MIQPQFSDFDPEYYPRVTQTTPREIERVRKRASRIFFTITALCIISFTIGIVVGIKFSGGARQEIVDAKTFNAMADIGKKIPFITGNEKKVAPHRENAFPRESYPYVLSVKGDYDDDTSQKMAAYISGQGHTVILSKHNDRFRIFIGPYQKHADALEALKKISIHTKYSLAENTRIIKR
ncbi:MAG: SPOR domain-containing protein [Spirochaetes bacterium]|nr:SPOR domain-containing protein [Spirochaetota bacterium]